VGLYSKEVNNCYSFNTEYIIQNLGLKYGDNTRRVGEFYHTILWDEYCKEYINVNVIYPCYNFNCKKMDCKALKYGILKSIVGSYFTRKI